MTNRSPQNRPAERRRVDSPRIDSALRKANRPADPGLTYTISPRSDEGPGWLSENVGKVIVGVAILVLLMMVYLFTQADLGFGPN